MNDRVRIVADYYRAESGGSEIPADVAQLIVDFKPTADARELQGLTIRVLAYASITERPVTLNLAWDVLMGIDGIPDTAH